MTGATDDRTLTSRYEYKFLIDRRLADPIRRFIEPFTQPDPYAEPRPGHRYPICSLYLDTPDLQLYRQTRAGEKNRFKMRIRSYSDGADDPVFFEIKRKVDTTVLKCRCRIERAEVDELLTRRVRSELDTSNDAALEEFSCLWLLGDTRPVVRVKYEREAYESKNGDPVRVTFDHRLAHLLTSDFNLQRNGRGWLDTPVDQTIFEVKFTGRYPDWLRELAHGFQLQRTSVPKYCWAIDSALDDGRYSPNLSAGLGDLGPRRQGLS